MWLEILLEYKITWRAKGIFMEENMSNFFINTLNPEETLQVKVVYPRGLLLPYTFIIYDVLLKHGQLSVLKKKEGNIVLYVDDSTLYFGNTTVDSLINVFK